MLSQQLFTALAIAAGLALLSLTTTFGYRIVNDPPQAPWDQVDHERFVPYEEGFTSRTNEYSNEFGTF